MELQGLFDGLCIVDEIVGKFSLVMLYEFMCEFGVVFECILMIGDIIYDLQMVFNVGCVSVGVSYGVYELDVFGVLVFFYIVYFVCELYDWF